MGVQFPSSTIPRAKMSNGKAEQVKLGQGINKNRVVDNLNDLDSEFCKTFDKLLALYKRITIRAYTIEEEKERLFKEDKKAVTKLLKGGEED